MHTTAASITTLTQRPRVNHFTAATLAMTPTLLDTRLTKLIQIQPKSSRSPNMSSKMTTTKMIFEDGFFLLLLPLSSLPLERGASSSSSSFWFLLCLLFLFRRRSSRRLRMTARAFACAYFVLVLVLVLLLLQSRIRPSRCSILLLLLLLLGLRLFRPGGRET